MEGYGPLISSCKFFHSGNVGDKPYNFQNVKEYARNKFHDDFSEPEKIIMIGSR